MKVLYYIYQNQIKRLSGLALDKNNDTNAYIAAELARKIVAGDAAAEEEFVRLNHSWLLFVIRRQFSRSSHHEDILQDAFMLVLNKLQQGQINKPESILSYLRTTALNIGFEYVKKDKKFASAVDQDFIGFIEDSHETILAKIIWDDKVNFVQQVIQELRKQRDKDILMDFYFNDLSKNKICSRLDLSSAHFDRVIYRAKKRLKELIEDHKSDGDHRQNNEGVKNKSKNIQNILKSCLFKVFNLRRGIA